VADLAAVEPIRLDRLRITGDEHMPCEEET
jgi:hypothetical protein